MFQTWRLQIREAEEAYDGGRLDEAGEILRAGDLRRYLPGQRLATRVASGMAQRARWHASLGDTSAGWRAVEDARSLGGETEDILAVRRLLIDRALSEAEKYLLIGDPAAALARLERLRQRNVREGTVRALRQVAMRMESAQRHARRGEFALAEAELAAAAALRPDLRWIAAEHEACRRKHVKCRQLVESLHAALADDHWTRALAAADQILEMAPDHVAARGARQRAWIEVGAAVVDSNPSPAPRAEPPARRRLSTHVYPRIAEGDTVAEKQTGPRFLLWIDAVGGYLTCLGDAVELGQAVPGTAVEVPILGDLSRRHARIHRDGEGYLIEPWGRVRVDGREARGPTLLADAAEIELGEGVQLRFRKPHPLSASARLDFISRHRTTVAVSGILLMAESCVLGPRPQSHIVCREWSGELILFRQGNGLACRATQPVEIDGQLYEGRGPLTPNSRVSGSDFSLSLEEI
jgi:hypothetical protein